jgi:hypothetical protein
MSARWSQGPLSLGPLVAIFASCQALACGTADIPVLGLATMDAGADGPASTLPPPFGTLADFCSSSGPPVLVDAFGDGGPVSTCPDQLAQRAFRYALCMCGDYVSDHALTTDAFDGTLGAYDPATAVAGGSVGVNGRLQATGTLQIDGSLWASNGTDVNATAGVVVSGDLRAQGEVRPSPSLAVGGDAWMASGIQTTGDVTVHGTLHVPGGQPVDVGTLSFGANVQDPFPTIPSACECEPSELVDIAGVVATYGTHNDDEALHVDAAMLENVQTDTTVPLPCGRIYLSSVTANAPIHITTMTNGARVALVVAGNISVTDFEINVSPGSEIDLFVGGSITASGTFLVGNQANPARARTYVGGTSVNLNMASTVAGNLYAPFATITLGASAPTTLYGSIFAKALTASADLQIHYDDAIMTPSATPSCPPLASCNTCSDCGGQACDDHTCGSCTDSSDCCPPLVCGPAGTCVGIVE